MRGESLRAARVSQHVPLKRIAAEIGVDASYLSHVEHGRRPATPETIAAYAKYVVLNAPEAGASGALGNDAFLAELIEWLRFLSPYDRTKLKSLGGLKRQSGEKSALDMFRDRLVTAKPLNKDNAITMVWETATDYLGVSQFTWLNILGCAIAHEMPFKLFYSPSPRFDPHEFLTLIQEYLSCLQCKELITIDSVSDLNFSHFPIDFFYVGGKFAFLCFAGPEYQRKNVLPITADTAMDIALKGYMERISSYRDQKIKLYFSQNDLLEFFREYAAIEELGAARYLFQSWPGSNDRPPEDYENEESSWWKYYRSLNKFDVGELARTRKRAWDALRRRMKSHAVRHICSKQVLQEWARTGYRPGFRAEQSPDDRANQIQYMITTLKTYPKCELAVVDHEVGRELGWAPLKGEKDDGSQNLSWLVQANEKVIIESHAKGEDGRLHEYQCVISDTDVADRFAKAFQATWDRLPREAKDLERTIGFLQSLDPYDARGAATRRRMLSQKRRVTAAGRVSL